MKALLVNPQYPPSFWSLEKSLSYMGVKAVCPPLGLLTVAATLPENWSLKLVDCVVRNITNEEWTWADIILFCGMYSQRDSLLSLIKEAKTRNKMVIVGGPYPSSKPEELVACGADIVVKGEIENIIDMLLEAIYNKQKGILENENKPDLETSPIPRFDLLNADDYSTLTIQTSRGCPFNCDFCDVIQIYGSKPRQKQVDQVIQEMEAIYEIGWRGEIFFSDDNFIGNKGYTKKLLEAIIPWSRKHANPFTYFTQASLNLGQEKVLLDLMVAAGFNTVFIGIETPDQQILQQAGKKQNLRKPQEESIQNIRQAGLEVLGSFIIGFDNETAGAGDRISEFVERCDIPIIMLNKLNILPNTGLWNRLKKEGRLIEDRVSDGIRRSEMNFIPTRPAADIDREFDEVITRLYDPVQYLSRTYRYFLAARPKDKVFEEKHVNRLIADIPLEKTPLKEELNILKQDLNVIGKLFKKYLSHKETRFLFLKQFFNILMNNPTYLNNYIACSIVAVSLSKRMGAIKEDNR